MDSARENTTRRATGEPMREELSFNLSVAASRNWAARRGTTGVFARRELLQARERGKRDIYDEMAFMSVYDGIRTLRMSPLLETSRGMVLLF